MLSLLLAIDWNINLGTIITCAVGALGLLWRLHRWDKSTDIRHVENRHEMGKLGSNIDQLTMKIDEGKDQLERHIEETKQQVRELKAVQVELGKNIVEAQVRLATLEALLAEKRRHP